MIESEINWIETNNEIITPFGGEDKASKEDQRCIFEYKHETWHDCSLGWLETFGLKFQKMPSPNCS